jgi:CHAT domain-containing protein
MIYNQVGDKAGQAAAYGELADIFGERNSSLKDLDRALHYYHLAHDLGYEAPLELVEIYLQNHRYSEAIEQARANLSGCLKMKDTSCEANALISLSEGEGLKGDLSAATVSLTRAEPLVAKERDYYLQGRLYYAQANVQRLSRHFDKASKTYEQLIDLIEQTKGQLGGKNLGLVGDTYDFIYDELIDSLYSLREGQNASEQSAIEALKYTEANKAREFVHFWGRGFVDATKRQLPSDLLEQERIVVSKRQRLQAELQNAFSSGVGDPIQIRRELDSATKNLDQFVLSLRKSYPTYASLEYPEAVALQHIPLHAGEMLVEFKVTDDSTFVWMIRGRQTEGNELTAFYRVPQKREWFQQRVFALRDAFNSHNPDAFDPHISEELFRVLFPGNYGTELLRSKSIVFVPDDVLFLIPFELLSPDATKGTFDLLSTPTKYYPSALSLQIARQAKRRSDWKNAFLGVGDPITSPEDERFGLATALARTDLASVQQVEPEGEGQLPQKARARGYSFERLPATAAEIQDISKLLAQRDEPVVVRLGIQATNQALLETDLAQFRFIHFATHGVLPVDTGIREPALILSFDGTSPEHMFLYASDIVQLRINAETVVLSACNTGSGKVTRAEGVMSLGRAFMTAGAESVTVSLWQVSDTSTQIFMERYYENLLRGKTKSEALSLARVSLFENGFKSPFFWAPFILTGE